MITPLQQYRLDLQQANFFPDPSQALAMQALDKLYQQLCQPHTLKHIWHKWFTRKTLTTGIYLWGDVGTGKTYLMDTFYNCMPDQHKQRIHFHAFMRHVQQRLAALQGERDPLLIIAKEFVQRAKLICFDEFFVHDIADAMILGKLLSALFSLKVILVATSNVKIENLYRDGLQRQRFQPTINLLTQHLQAIEVDQQQDYRLRHTKPANLYFSPLDANSEQAMRTGFAHYAYQQTLHGTHLTINGRQLATIRCAEGVAWFDFAELCCQPRSSADYLLLAQQFHTILLSHLPQLTKQGNKIITRFINLIDILYDEQVRLMLSASCSLDALSVDKHLALEFKRTKSRLQEMQSQYYLEKTLAKKYRGLGQL
ncbi:MAG: AFG1 family ATPase [Gammaproteobacteria bacterium]|nr:AFG1 family ATPase [Gammaproteobacteria bacterium]